MKITIDNQELEVSNQKAVKIKREKDTDLDDLCKIVKKAEADFGILIYKEKDENNLTIISYPLKAGFSGLIGQIANVSHQLYELHSLNTAKGKR